MSVGNDIIDQDHRYLLCLVNSVELALRHEDTESLLPVYLEQLTEYAKSHFAREETIQKKVQYPQLDGHKRSHGEIIEHLAQLRADVDRYLAEKAGGGVIDVELEKTLHRHMVELTREWILGHILKEDKRMEYYLRKVPRNFT